MWYGVEVIFYAIHTTEQTSSSMLYTLRSKSHRLYYTYYGVTTKASETVFLGFLCSTGKILQAYTHHRWSSHSTYCMYQGLLFVNTQRPCHILGCLGACHPSSVHWTHVFSGSSELGKWKREGWRGKRVGVVTAIIRWWVLEFSSAFRKSLISQAALHTALKLHAAHPSSCTVYILKVVIFTSLKLHCINLSSCFPYICLSSCTLTSLKLLSTNP